MDHFSYCWNQSSMTRVITIELLWNIQKLDLSLRWIVKSHLVDQLRCCFLSLCYWRRSNKSLYWWRAIKSGAAVSKLDAPPALCPHKSLWETIAREWESVPADCLPNFRSWHWSPSAEATSAVADLLGGPAIIVLPMFLQNLDWHTTRRATLSRDVWLDKSRTAGIRRVVHIRGHLQWWVDHKHIDNAVLSRHSKSFHFNLCWKLQCEIYL